MLNRSEKFPKCHPVRSVANRLIARSGLGSRFSIPLSDHLAPFQNVSEVAASKSVLHPGKVCVSL